MRICALCRKEADGDEHHLIPLKFKRFTNENLDKFRIVLCPACHRKVSRVWNEIFWNLKEVLE